MIELRRLGLAAVAGLLLLVHASGGGAQLILEEEVTADGLHRVHPSIIPSAWIRTDVDLSQYTRVYFLPTAVQFRELPRRRYTARVLETATEFPVSDLMKARLTDSFGEDFYEAVSGVRTFELSDELGRDVLLVRGYLADVISGVPPDLAGANVGTVRWAWEASMGIELRDAMTDEVIARTIDRERIEGPFDAEVIYALTPQVTRSWSRLLVTRIRELAGLYPSRLQRLQERSELER